MKEEPRESKEAKRDLQIQECVNDCFRSGRKKGFHLTSSRCKHKGCSGRREVTSETLRAEDIVFHVSWVNKWQVFSV